MIAKRGSTLSRWLWEEKRSRTLAATFRWGFGKRERVIIWGLNPSLWTHEVIWWPSYCQFNAPHRLHRSEWSQREMSISPVFFRAKDADHIIWSRLFFFWVLLTFVPENWQHEVPQFQFILHKVPVVWTGEPWTHRGLGLYKILPQIQQVEILKEQKLASENVELNQLMLYRYRTLYNPASSAIGRH